VRRIRRPSDQPISRSAPLAASPPGYRDRSVTPLVCDRSSWVPDAFRGSHRTTRAHPDHSASAQVVPVPLWLGRRGDLDLSGDDLLLQLRDLILQLLRHVAAVVGQEGAVVLERADVRTAF